MSDLEIHYQILGLEPTATPQEIKQAYRDLTKVWHPDRFANDPRLQQKAQEKLKEINRAYDRLKNIPPSKQQEQQRQQRQETPSESGHSKSNEPYTTQDDSINAKNLNYFAPHFKKIIVGLIIISALFLIWIYSSKKAAPSVASLDKLVDASDQLAPSGNLRVYVLDVGQGDSLLVISPQGKTILIDAGSIEAEDTLITSLRKHSVRQIDLLIATHPHDDHIGGMKKVFDTFRVKKFLDSGQTYGSSMYEKLLREIQENKTPYIKAVRGQSIEVEPEVVFDVYGPPSPLFTESDVEQGHDLLHANAIVLRLKYGSFSMLFASDIVVETEDSLLASAARVSANVLKIGLHGSPQGTSNKFLTAVNPKFAIISTGRNNPYGNPSALILDRLKSANIKIMRTDLNGEIEVFSNGKSYDVRAGS